MASNLGRPPRIAIPMPHGSDPEYAQRAIPQYERAVALSGGDPVRIALDWNLREIKNVIQGCGGVLLPGSKADVDPERFHAARSPRTAPADYRRDQVDNVLLENAYRLRKPVLGICYGLQSLNVYRTGSLIQHIPDFLPQETRSKVNHEAGSKVPVAHSVEIDSESLLGKILCNEDRRRPSGQLRPSTDGSKFTLPVNSSHHQSAYAIGTSLRIIARCPDDGIVEALESPEESHFVLAVQWHPERSVDEDEASRRIFQAFVEAAARTTR
jgi:putative glutamine amidotransferase